MFFELAAVRWSQGGRACDRIGFGISRSTLLSCALADFLRYATRALRSRIAVARYIRFVGLLGDLAALLRTE